MVVFFFSCLELIGFLLLDLYVVAVVVVVVVVVIGTG